MKRSESVLIFKIKLEEFKKSKLADETATVGQFWDVSNEVLSRIEGSNYAANKAKHNEYLWFNPHVAKKRFINLYSTGMHS